jgi:hypothetical protein
MDKDDSQRTTLVPKLADVEDGMRDFIRRDLASNRRPRPAGDQSAPNGINSVVQGISNAAIAEVERVMGELNQVRDMLRSEGDRVQREIAHYHALNEAAMTSMKIIGDSLAQWRPTGR